MKVVLPQSLPSAASGRLVATPGADAGQTAALSFEACIDLARERREPKAEKAFEFAELGVFGPDRPADERAEAMPTTMPAEAAPGVRAALEHRAQAPWRRERTEQTVVVQPRPAGEPRSDTQMPAQPGHSIDGGWGAALSTAAPRFRAVEHGEPTAAIAVSAPASGPGRPALVAADARVRSAGPPEPPRSAEPARQGPVRVSLQQTERGLVVQAIVTGGVSEETITRLRQRAEEMAVEHGLTLADLTINGTPIAASASRRTR